MLIRRIRKSELEALAMLLSEQKLWPDLSKHYLNHRLWVQRALSEVRGENRTVFGAFVPSPTRDGTRFANRLAGCIFVKLTALQESAELKGLAICDEYLTSQTSIEEQRTQIAERLIGKAVRFCQVREILKLEIEIPQDDHGVLSLFLRMGFRVTAIREKFRPGKFFCVLERTVGDTYAADPFDYMKVGRWLLRAVLPCEIVDPPGMIDNVPVLKFYVDAPHSALQAPQFRAKQLSGLIAVLEEDECTDKDIKHMITNVMKIGQIFVRYVLLTGPTSKSAQKLLATANVGSFALDEVKAIAGAEASSLAIPFSRDEIGGVLTVLEHDAIFDYTRLGTFQYFLLSGLGGSLEVDEDTQLILAIYCPDWPANGTGIEAGIVGFAEITGIVRCPFEQAMDAFPGVPSALSKEDLEFYRTFGDSQVVILCCEQVRLLTSPIAIPFEEEGILEEAIPEWTYLHRELVENLASAVYLSETASAVIQMLPERTTREHPDFGPDFIWRGERDEEELQRLTRKSPLTLDVLYLEKALRSSKAVCFVEVSGAAGSGVLVGTNLILTCKHVVYRSDDGGPHGFTSAEVKVTFNHRSRTDECIEVLADVLDVHPQCDAALLRLRETPPTRNLEPVCLSAIEPSADDDLSLLHYPLGGDLKVTLSNGGVVGTYTAHRTFQYVTDTAGGSSGGPCFNSEWELVGIHRAEKSRWFGRCGEGVLVPMVLDSWIRGFEAKLS